MRPSDADQDRAVRELRSGYASGYISLHTLERRLDQVLASNDLAELDALVGDLPKDPTSHGRGLRDRIRRAREPREEPDAVTIALPGDIEPPLLVGRSNSCDAVLAEETVSRRHLELRPIDGRRWLAVDLGSTNGTWYLGRRVARVVVGRGDRLLVGNCRVTLR
jgi:hypothetical protein